MGEEIGRTPKKGETKMPKVITMTQEEYDLESYYWLRDYNNNYERDEEEETYGDEEDA